MKTWLHSHGILQAGQRIVAVLLLLLFVLLLFFFFSVLNILDNSDTKNIISIVSKCQVSTFVKIRETFFETFSQRKRL